MMKNIIKYTSIAMMLLAFSCSKEEPNNMTKGEARVRESATFEVKGFSTHLQAKSDDDLRATLTAKGYQAPDFDISLEELKANNIKFHWQIEGLKLRDEGSIGNYITNLSELQTGEDAVLFEEKEGQKRLKVYYSPRAGLELDKMKAWFAVGGKMTDGALAFTSEMGTSPNEKIVGLKKGEKLEGLHIPLMTRELSYEDLNNTAERFTPQGFLMSLIFFNTTGEDVTIQDIIIEPFDDFNDSGAAFFEGSFTSPSEFKGIKATQDLEFPVYNGSTRGYTLKSEATPITEEVKEQLPIFNIWGYQSPDNSTLVLRMKLRLVIDGKTMKSIRFNLVPPHNEESGDDLGGRAFQIPITLDRVTTGLDIPNDMAMQNGPTLLYPFTKGSVSQDVKKLVNTNNEVGYFSQEAFDDRYNTPSEPIFRRGRLPNELVGYGSFAIPGRYALGSYYAGQVDKKLPWSAMFPITKEEYKKALPSIALDFSPVTEDGEIEHLDTRIRLWLHHLPSIIITNDDEYGDILFDYSEGDFIQRVPNPQDPTRSIIYALRASQTKWRTAVQYRWEGSLATNDLRLVMKAVHLKPNMIISQYNVNQVFDKMKAPNFFTGSKVCQKTLLYCGYKETENGAVITDKGTPYISEIENLSYNPTNPPIIYYLVLPQTPSGVIRFEAVKPEESNKYKFAPVFGVRFYLGA